MRAQPRNRPFVHLFGWSFATPIIAGGLTWIALGALGADQPEQLRFLLVVLVITVPLGAFLGIASFLLARGIRGWRAYFAQRQAYTAAAEQDPPPPAQPAAEPAVDPQEHLEVEDPRELEHDADLDPRTWDAYR